MTRKRLHYVKGKYYRVNEEIRAPKIRVIDPEKGQIGILPRDEALKKAQEEELDLVEVAPSANPPVVKLIDFAKFKYEQAKKKKTSKGTTPETKQLRFRPFMDEHDIKVRTKKMTKFLQNGNRVKIQIRFFGREVTKKNYGFDLIEKILNEIGEKGRLVDKPKLKGKVLEALIVPK